MDAVADYGSPERERRDDRAPAERDQTPRVFAPITSPSAMPARVEGIR
jgi:hypothetical protein